MSLLSDGSDAGKHLAQNVVSKRNEATPRAVCWGTVISIPRPADKPGQPYQPVTQHCTACNQSLVNPTNLITRSLTLFFTKQPVRKKYRLTGSISQRRLVLAHNCPEWKRNYALHTT